VDDERTLFPATVGARTIVDMTDDRRGDLRAGKVLPVRADPANGPSENQVRGPRWRRTSQGYYVPSSVSADDVDQRIVEASVVVPTNCAINGWANIRWRGGRWFDGRSPAGDQLPVDIVTSTRDIRKQPGIQPGGESFNPTWVTWVDGLPLIDERYAVAFMMRYAGGVRDAANVLSLAAYNDIVSVQDVSDWLTPGQNGMTGVPQAREAVGWAEENVWSPQELPMSLVWQIEAERPRPLCNRPVFDLATGRHIATPDLIDPDVGVAGEYEGPTHLDRAQRDRDVRREGDLRAHDLEVVTMTGADRGNRSHFIGRLHDAYRAAERKPRSERTWTIVPPTWWVPVHTVEQRRALTDEQRARFLRHRSA
jgi:hypothetical protein